MDALATIQQQAETGDRAGARQAAIALLRAEPQNVRAWLVLATLLDDPAQQAQCYKRVLRLAPGHPQATTLLARLQSPPPAVTVPPPTTATSLTCPHCGASVIVALGDALRATRAFCERCGQEFPLAPPAAEPPTATIPTLFEYESAAGKINKDKMREAMRADLVTFVVSELSAQANRNELIRDICERAELSWPAAEKFVNRIAMEHAGEITKRQSPLLLFTSIGTIVIGIILLSVSCYSIYLYYAALTGKIHRSDLSLSFDVIAWGLWLGAGMTLGGLIGIIRTLNKQREEADF